MKASKRTEARRKAEMRDQEKKRNRLGPNYVPPKKKSSVPKSKRNK